MAIAAVYDIQTSVMPCKETMPTEQSAHIIIKGVGIVTPFNRREIYNGLRETMAGSLV